MIESAVASAIGSLQGVALLIALFLVVIMVTLRVPESNLTKTARVKIIKWLIIVMGFSVAVFVWLVNNA